MGAVAVHREQEQHAGHGAARERGGDGEFTAEHGLVGGGAGRRKRGEVEPLGEFAGVGAAGDERQDEFAHIQFGRLPRTAQFESRRSVGAGAAEKLGQVGAGNPFDEPHRARPGKLDGQVAMLEQGEEFPTFNRFARRPKGADAAQPVVELVGELVEGSLQVVLGVGKAQFVAFAGGVFGQPGASAGEPEADQKDQHQRQAGATRRGVKVQHGETGAGYRGGLAGRAAQGLPRKAVKGMHAGGRASAVVSARQAVYPRRATKLLCPVLAG